MRHLRVLTAVSMIAACAFSFGASAAERSKAKAADKTWPMVEDYVEEPMPAGFQIINTELEGPVFANAQGLTFYRWPINTLRNGDTGEAAGTPRCYNVRVRETRGFASPYPAGAELPNPDTRPTCTDHWPPVYAAADSKAVGNFTILDRTDGTKQWAYKGYALYTSHLDKGPGQTNGGTYARKGRDRVSNGAPRYPVGPTPVAPPQFEVATRAIGRLLVLNTDMSVYSYDGDAPNKSNCTGSCLDQWEPVPAPEAAVAQGEWSVVIRTGGGRQWAYRGKPLYRYIDDLKERSYEGSDIPGWHNVFTQMAPSLPKGFTVVPTNGGLVVADPSGKTIYQYYCAEDTEDTTFCDAPDSPQEYRWAMCGGGDPVRCNETFPYVIADKDAKSDSILWSVMDINPKTGRAESGPDSLRVWAYRARPIYNFAGDRDVGDIGGDSWGQDHGGHNGFTAFWQRDAYGELD